MITVISGKPGAGKTALLVQMLLAFAKEGRRIYQDQRPSAKHGGEVRPAIPDLNVKHDLLADARRWHEPGEVADGSVIVIDEAQDLWRQRPSGSKIPPEIAAMETHRHRGLDIIVLTQAPNLLDQNLRGLVGRHIHLRDMGVFGRRWNEWFDQVGETTTPSGLKAAPVQKSWKLPTEAFQHYTSASVHIKPQRSIPRTVITLAVCAVLLCVGVWYAYKSIKGKIDAAQQPSLVPASTVAGKPAQSPGAALASVSTRTVLAVSAPVKMREPYAGFGLHLAGQWTHGTERRAYFALSIEGRQVALLRDADLYRAGYGWRDYGPCAGVLIFAGLERVVRCDAPVPASRVAGPQAAASAPV